jgi:erythromycin esterase-like protein
MAASQKLLRGIRAAALPLEEARDDYDALLFQLGDARVVLIGEATHGTHEFYRERARITRRLIEEKGFAGVAIEGDWPDAWRVNRFVRGGLQTTGEKALGGFARFPGWMWRNRDVLGFVNWLHAENARRAEGAPTPGFFGLDLYSLYASIDAVLGYLEDHDPDAARRARSRYGCFEPYGRDAQEYGLAAGSGRIEACEDAVVATLDELSRRTVKRLGEEEFFALMNARLVKNAEAYYRAMFRGSVESWNLRDGHMMETLEALLSHLDREWERSRLVVWAHNSHLGDARATEMSRWGEKNLGQLCRERFGRDVFSIGFTTYEGTVSAASSWDGDVERKWVRPALEGSVEELLHEVGPEHFLLTFDHDTELADALREERLERAIGVVYRPETERHSHYFGARLADQFDAVIHWEETRAVEPLGPTERWKRGEAPETFPFAV